MSLIKKISRFALVSIASVSVLSGCNGALNDALRIGPPVSKLTPIPSGSPLPSPSSGASSSPILAGFALATGVLVDYDTSLPVAGEMVSVKASNAIASVTVATTGPDGSFKFTIAPANYILIIGSDSPDALETTYHNTITLQSGLNKLEEPTPKTDPNGMLKPSQMSKNFRRLFLTTDEKGCVDSVNFGRIKTGLGLLTADENGYEFLREISRLQVQQENAVPNTLITVSSYNILGPIQAFANNGFSSCDAYANTYTFTPGNQPYSAMTQKLATWYAGEFVSSATQTYASELDMQSP